MIISHRHRYIFLHCRKTAGSSICVALTRTLGPEDIQLSAVRETLDEGIALPARMIREAREEARDGGRFSQRLALRGLKGKDRRNHDTKTMLMRRYARLLGESQPHHAFATSIARAFPEAWAAYPKFCVVRNPWTKAVSDYYWRTRTLDPRPTFADFVRALESAGDLGGVVNPRYFDNWPLYTIGDEIVADHVIRFENLLPGLTETLAALKVPYDGWLPNAKGSHRPKQGARADPRSLYTPELRDTVGRLYEREIAAFGYSFDGCSQRISPAATSCSGPS